MTARKRSAPGVNASVMIAFRCPPALLKRLDRVSVKRLLTRTEAILRTLREGLPR